jgi:hypothetical protein
MKRMKNPRLALLAALLFAAGSITMRARAPQQTSDPPKADSSTAKKDKKPKQTDPAPQTPSEIPASEPATANKPAAPTAATRQGTPSSGTPAPRPANAQHAGAANGGGVVWVNTDSRIYHKPGTRWYGKTKHGKYMAETDAKKAGYRAAAKE